MEVKEWYKSISGKNYLVGEIIGTIYFPDFTGTMRYFEALGKQYNPNFTISDKDMPVYELLFNYFTNYIHFNLKSGIDIKKGLLLCGNHGVGKSTIIQMFIDFFSFNKVERFSMFTLSEAVSEKGFGFLNSLKLNQDIILDDIGSENEVFYFGNRQEIFTSILMKYEEVNFPKLRPDESKLENIVSEDNFQSQRNEVKRPARIFATTNLTLNQFCDRYGSRVHSRIAAFFNVIRYPNVVDKRVDNANIVKL